MATLKLSVNRRKAKLGSIQRPKKSHNSRHHNSYKRISHSCNIDAQWKRGSYNASAKVWIEKGQLARIERRFDPGKSPYSFDVSLDVFTDEPSLEVPTDRQDDPNFPVPAARQPAPVDDPCADVNAAYGLTIATQRYSYTIKATNNGKLNPVTEQVRVIDGALYLKRGKGSWYKHDMPVQLSTMPQGSMFHICVRQSETKDEIHYSAWLLEGGSSNPIDMWVSIATGKFSRTSRNYSPTGQMYHARVVEQLFNYEPPNATVPEQYISDVFLANLWAADNDLR